MSELSHLTHDPATSLPDIVAGIHSVYPQRGPEADSPWSLTPEVESLLATGHPTTVKSLPNRL